MLTVLSLLVEDTDCRFEKLCRPEMMLCGLCEERREDDRLGEVSAAYGCRGGDDSLLGDVLGNGVDDDGGVAGGGPLGGVSRFGITPCLDQRFASSDVRGGDCSVEPRPMEDTDDHDDRGRPSSPW